MTQLTLTLPDTAVAELTDAGLEVGQTPEDLASDIVRRALAVRKFRAARKTILDTLGPDAPQVEDDIFNQIS